LRPLPFPAIGFPDTLGAGGSAGRKPAALRHALTKYDGRGKVSAARVRAGISLLKIFGWPNCVGFLVLLNRIPCRSRLGLSQCFGGYLNEVVELAEILDRMKAAFREECAPGFYGQGREHREY